MGRPQILFLDAYDSFSNNVVSLLTALLGADVAILHIDTPRFDQSAPSFPDELRHELQHYDAVVCGPGPGSPTTDADVGLIKHIWELEDDCLLPVLGICLGFQSLAVSCGAQIKKVTGGGLHGMIREIDFRTDLSLARGNIFENVPPFKATLYHSLCADIGQNSVDAADWPALKWQTRPQAPGIVPLAWIEEKKNGSSERLLMGVSHAAKPFWALQYHPESVCSEVAGHQIISNWFQEALRWNTKHGRVTKERVQTSAAGSVTPSLGQQFRVLKTSSEAEDEGAKWWSEQAIALRYTCSSIPLPSHIEVPDVVELLQSNQRDHIILDSASAQANRIGLDVRGRYSIIALDIEDSLKLEYTVGSEQVVVCLPSSVADGKTNRHSVRLQQGQTVWHFLASFMEERKMSLPDAESPFTGGFMGYISYELGLERIAVKTDNLRSHGRPDLCFAWVTRSVVVDHLEATLRVQNLQSSADDSKQWIESIKATLLSSPLWTDGLRLNDKKLKTASHFTPPITPTGTASPVTIKPPLPMEYESKVKTCQDYIAAGNSYELCLTDQTTITRTVGHQSGADTMSSNSWAPSSATKTPSSWHLYRTLRTRQPAPFGSYIRIGGATLISSSPERFLEYDRKGLCSMRPMKGTVRKSAACYTLEEAEKILHIPKEEAENLMIVDLVRHDLHSICGPGNVQVPQLMKVEEYASVFQMISVVEGQLPVASDETQSAGYTGLDVLAASLPPGSMTGAPKRRSCEILQEIEGHRERSLYSGVVGYMDVTGNGDWSVTIRSLFRWDDETVRNEDGSETEVWRIGAGGAVTALSTAEGEREEMFTKLKGPLAAFEVKD